MVGFLPDVRVRIVAPDEVRDFDPDFRSFFNMNTLEDLDSGRGRCWPGSYLERVEAECLRSAEGTGHPPRPFAFSRTDSISSRTGPQCLRAVVRLGLALWIRVHGRRISNANVPACDLRFHLDGAQVRRIPGAVRNEAVGLVDVLLEAGRVVAELCRHRAGRGRHRRVR